MVTSKLFPLSFDATAIQQAEIVPTPSRAAFSTRIDEPDQRLRQRRELLAGGGDSVGPAYWAQSGMFRSELNVCSPATSGNCWGLPQGFTGVTASCGEVGTVWVAR